MSEQMSFEDVIGAYEANFGSAVYDSLFLYSDTTYVRKYGSRGGKVFVDTGTFRFGDIGYRHYSFYSTHFVMFQPECDEGGGRVNANSAIPETTVVNFPIMKLGNSVRIHSCFPKMWFYRKRIG
ncbi:MAG: hypothetical protein IPH59_15090 [bacterium]|nr:hypothetical protein [bacterium]